MHFQYLILFLAAGLSVNSNNPLSAATSVTLTTSPHVLMILTDDMGFADVSCNGGLDMETPHIDRLASEGTRFTQCYVAAPICSPSRAAILSGMFPGRLHLNSYLQTRAGNKMCDQNDFMDPKFAHLPKAFHDAGYATAHYGKWHLGGGRDVDNAPRITQYGYDEYISTWESPDPAKKLGIQYAPWDRKTEPGQVPRHKRTEFLIDKTMEFLKRGTGKPCFITLWPDDMHDPFRPSAEMAKKYGASPEPDKTPYKNFQGVLDEYDRQIGRLMDGLKKANLEKNTIVIFMSDNGPAPNYGFKRAGVYRGMKLSLYEGGTRIPFMIRWPGHVPAGKVDDSSIISSLDLCPTLCKLAGVKLPETAAALNDGMDVSAAFLGTPVIRDKPIFWEYGRKMEGYGRPRRPIDRSPNVAVRRGEWKLLVNDDETSTELYNIPKDPSEQHNLANKHPDMVKDLTARALDWRKQLPGRTQ
jgi:arylsulfatase A-like enzyme